MLNDHVDLGNGGGRLNVLASSLGSSGRLDGGGNADSILQITLAGKQPWSVQATAGTATSPGQGGWSWQGFPTQYLSGGVGGITWRGSQGDDRVYGENLVSARGRDGNDHISVTPTKNAPQLYGGRGHDTFEVDSTFDDIDNVRAPNVTISLPTGKVTYPGSRLPAASIIGFDDYGGYADSTLKIVGTSGPDYLHGAGCQMILKGGAGDDHLHTGRYYDQDGTRCVNKRPSVAYGGPGKDALSGPKNAPTQLHGGAGNDYLSGASGDDRLYGDAGRDRADGGAGRDLCRAEKKAHCEK